MRIHDPRLRNMAQALSLSVSLLSNELTFIFLFAVTAAGVVVPCGGHKSLPVHHP